MAQYQVPQFIEIEDKIFGPLTLKQFIYLAGGGGLCLVFFTLLPMWLVILLGIPVMAFSGALALDTSASMTMTKVMKPAHIGPVAKLSVAMDMEMA